MSGIDDVMNVEKFYRDCIEALLIGLEVNNREAFMMKCNPTNCLKLGRAYTNGVKKLSIEQVITEQNAGSINKYMRENNFWAQLQDGNKIIWGELVTEFVRYLNEKSAMEKANASIQS
jgi:hypothetical protein